MMDNAWSGQVNEAVLANYTKFKDFEISTDIDISTKQYTQYTGTHF